MNINKSFWNSLICRNISHTLSICIFVLDTVRCGSGHINHCSRLWSSARYMHGCWAHIRNWNAKLFMELMSWRLYNSSNTVLYRFKCLNIFRIRCYEFTHFFSICWIRCHQLLINYTRIPWIEWQKNPPDMEKFEWDVAETRLLINSEGCGYPPHVNCTEFAKKYGYVVSILLK